MPGNRPFSVAIVHPREHAEAFDDRFAARWLLRAYMSSRWHTPMRSRQIERVQLVLVWRNPIEGGRTRKLLSI